jgi:ketosteroid isomerase-like protein
VLERAMTFPEYVREYGLQRSEGVVLRYLSEAYRALAQSVPARFKTEAVEALVVDLGAVVRNVDSSLIEEWEELRSGGAVVGDGAAAARPRKRGLDARELAARVRTEMHRLLDALARKDWEEAVACVRADGEWTKERFESELAGYWTEHRAIVTTPAARAPRNTVLKEVEDGVWEVVQRIVDPEGDEDWAIVGRVEAAKVGNADEPAVEVVRVGR